MTLHMLACLVMVRRLIAECSSPNLTAVLAGAVTAAGSALQDLNPAIIHSCSAISLSMLSYCTALESCVFLNTTCQLDLLSLHVLPRLSHLRLEGQTDCVNFVGIHRLVYVTSVAVKDPIKFKVRSHVCFRAACRIFQYHLVRPSSCKGMACASARHWNTCV